MKSPTIKFYDCFDSEEVPARRTVNFSCLRSRTNSNFEQMLAIKTECEDQTQEEKLNLTLTDIKDRRLNKKECDSNYVKINEKVRNDLHYFGRFRLNSPQKLHLIMQKIISNAKHQTKFLKNQKLEILDTKRNSKIKAKIFSLSPKKNTALKLKNIIKKPNECNLPKFSKYDDLNCKQNVHDLKPLYSRRMKVLNRNKFTNDINCCYLSPNGTSIFDFQTNELNKNSECLKSIKCQSDSANLNEENKTDRRRKLVYLLTRKMLKSQ